LIADEIEVSDKFLTTTVGCAVKNGYLEKNPLANIDEITIPDEPVRILSPEELRRLLESASGDLKACLAIVCSSR
jgi:hypothetical protein